MKVYCLLSVVLAMCMTAPALSFEGEYPQSNTYTFRLDQECTEFFSIHGLWPNWGENCPGPAFNMSALDPIMTTMNKEWLSCKSQGNEAFWTHEWTTHGTCSGMEQFDYFNQVLKLYSSYAGHCNDTSNYATCTLCFTKDLKYLGTTGC